MNHLLKVLSETLHQREVQHFNRCVVTKEAHAQILRAEKALAELKELEAQGKLKPDEEEDVHMEPEDAPKANSE